MLSEITVKPIGTIHTPYKDVAGMPVQPAGAEGIAGTIELLPDYQEGLMDIEGFSHLILLYHFHKVDGFNLQAVPFMDDKPHGIFATRIPRRPNAIGISIVRLREIEGNLLHIIDVDMLDKTPLVDIKPFFPKYDNKTDVKFGWLEGKENIDITKVRSDARFK